MVGLDQAAIDFGVGLIGASSGSGLAWWFMQRWMARTDERLEAIEKKALEEIPTTCADKMGQVYERIDLKTEHLEEKIKNQEDCVGDELVKMNDKLSNLGLNVTKIVTVMSMQASGDQNVRDILNSKIN